MPKFKTDLSESVAVSLILEKIAFMKPLLLALIHLLVTGWTSILIIGPLYVVSLESFRIFLNDSHSLPQSHTHLRLFRTLLDGLFLSGGMYYFKIRVTSKWW